MFIVKPVKESNIKQHHCSNLEVAEVVKNYLIDKYQEDVTIQEEEKGLLYSSPNFKIVYELEYTDIGPIHLRIDDLVNFKSLIGSISIDEQNKNFVRIPCLLYNICLSEQEFNEVILFMEKNKEILAELDKKVHEYFNKSLLK